MVNSMTRPCSGASGADNSGAAACVAPMMKLPSAFTGGTSPSGSSLAATYPTVWGSRVGNAGRSVFCGGGAAVVCAKVVLTAIAMSSIAMLNRDRVRSLMELLGVNFNSPQSTHFRFGGGPIQDPLLALSHDFRSENESPGLEAKPSSRETIRATRSVRDFKVSGGSAGL